MRLHRILWTLAAALLLLPALAGAAVITYEREELPGGGRIARQGKQATAHGAYHRLDSVGLAP